MKKILILFAIVMMAEESVACDQCSAVVGSGAILEGHYVGYRLRYRRQFLEIEQKKSLGNPKHLDHFSAPGELKELYTAHELFGNYHVHGDWHLTASIPVVNNYRSSDGVTVNDVYGVGDPWLMARFQHVSTRDNGKFVCGAGVGAKFPLGYTSVMENDVEVDLDMQPGSGSMDFLSSLVLLYEYKSWFVLNQNVFKWTGEGQDGYRYGNSLAASVDIGKTILDKGEDSWKVNLLIGPYAEWTGKDAQDGLKSGGLSTMVFANAGLRVNYNRAVFSINGQSGVMDDMDSEQLPTTHRLLMSLQYEI